MLTRAASLVHFSLHLVASTISLFLDCRSLVLLFVFECFCLAHCYPFFPHVVPQRASSASGGACPGGGSERVKERRSDRPISAPRRSLSPPPPGSGEQIAGAGVCVSVCVCLWLFVTLAGHTPTINSPLSSRLVAAFCFKPSARSARSRTLADL